MRRRKIFGIGLIGCLLFLFLMSRFLWAIEIEGNLAVTDDMFLDFLKQNGIHAGMKRSELVSHTLEEKIREQFDIITWTSVQLDGTRLVIYVKENEHPGETKSTETAENSGTDLCAQADGIIIKMITRSGVPLKKPGDEVKKGEIIVQGQVPIYNEDGTVREVRYCDADADIYIQYVYPVQEMLPRTYLAKEYTGRTKKRHFVRTLEKEYYIPVGTPFRYCDSIMEEEQLHLFGNLYLPLFMGNVTYREYLPTELKYNPEEAGVLLNKKLSQLVLSLDEKGVQIIQKDVKIVKDKKNYFLKGNFTVLSQAVEHVPSESEEPEELIWKNSQ
ncbi:MAG: sporulation protein YqfD [Clostridiales bacterium]|nr:sporulation protein YqfD [Clostridiales bacterium]